MLSDKEEAFETHCNYQSVLLLQDQVLTRRSYIVISRKNSTKQGEKPGTVKATVCLMIHTDRWMMMINHQIIISVECRIFKTVLFGIFNDFCFKCDCFANKNIIWGKIFLLCSGEVFASAYVQMWWYFRPLKCLKCRNKLWKMFTFLLRSLNWFKI